MKKHFFSKYYAYCMIFLIIIIIISNAGIIIASNLLYRNQKSHYFESLAMNLVSAIGKSPEGIITSGYCQDVLKYHQGIHDFSFYIYDDNARLIYGIKDDGSADLTGSDMQKIDIDMLRSDKKYYITDIRGSGNGKYEVFILENEAENGEIYYFITVSSADGIISFLYRTISVTILISLIIILAAMVTFRVIFKKDFINPFHDMVRTAEQFMKGNYEVKIKEEDPEEMRSLARSFNEMAVIMENLESTQTEFITNVSHELRTPMTTIGGFVDGMLDGVIPEEQYGYYLRLVSDEIKHLSRIISIMSDILKFNSKDMHINIEAVNIINITTKTISLFEKKISEKNISVEYLYGGEIIINADTALISKMLYCLVDNAVKFVNDNGSIVVGISKKPGGNIIKIKNTGGGIPESEIPKIFNRFYKTDKSRSPDSSGIGAGLYFVNSIVKLHGGTVKVNSVLNEYIEFEIWIPSLSGG